MAFRLLLTFILLILGGCISQEVRLPATASQVYKNSSVQEGLKLLALNHVLIDISDETLHLAEKSEIDQTCRHIEEPFWAEKLSDFLSEIQKRPELLGKFHILAFKKGDSTKIETQTDLDGTVTISVQYLLSETYGKVGFQTNLPCSGSLTTYIDRSIKKVDYEFPSLVQFNEALSKLPKKKEVAAFSFDVKFLMYLAERGIFLKINPKLIFEKQVDGKLIFSNLMSKFSQQLETNKLSHTNYWFKKIFDNSKQAQVMQLFGLVMDKELKYGIKIDSGGESSKRKEGEADLTYLFTSYNVENEKVNSVSLDHLEKCMNEFTLQMTGLKFRRPADNDQNSYLYPGYYCSTQVKSD